MKWSNEELTSIADDTVEYIERAIDELKGVKEYEECKEALEQIKEELLDNSETYREKYHKECEEEKAYENLEYERSRLE